MQTPGRHTFDGDGQVIAFAFDGSGRVRFRNRFVRTRGFLDEQVCAVFRAFRGVGVGGVASLLVVPPVLVRRSRTHLCVCALV
jgi:hypothetical protein